jgi:FkbM family methyltransferase
MKIIVKWLLQRILGYQRYLFIFALYTIRRLRSGNHEEPFDAFIKLIPKNGTVLDIGANIGVMTAVLALHDRKRAVYSFEPIPENLITLKQVVKHFALTNVTIFETALGNENGTVQMIRPTVAKVKMQGLSHVVSEHEDNKEDGSLFSVALKRLDDIPEVQQLSSISAIKLDVENFEFEVIKGAQNILRTHRPYIYCELWANEVRTNCMNFLRAIGYSPYVCEDKKFVPYTNQDENNFIFIPDGKQVSIES